MGEAEVLEQLCGADERHSAMLRELTMARRALEAEYERNSALCKLNFCADDSTTISSVSSLTSDMLLDVDDPSASLKQTLWSLPPVSCSAKPSEVAIIVGHEVCESVMNEVEQAFETKGVQTLRLQAGVSGDETRLAK